MKISGVTNETLRFYSECHKYLTKFISKNKKCYLINEDTVNEYINYMRNVIKVNDATINCRLRGLRTFLYFCADKKYMKKIPIHMIKERNKKDKIPYSDNEIEKLLMIPDVSDLPKNLAFTRIRNWAVSFYLNHTGNRLSTLVNIKTDDINFREKTIYLRHMKNSQPQSFPLDDDLTKVLFMYYCYRKKIKGEYFFCSYYGEPISTNGMQHAINRYNKSCGVKKTSIHLHRYKFAIDFCMSGGNVFQLQRLLNHSTLEMSYHYSKLNATDLREQINKCKRKSLH